jgi:hypothetical protein
MRELAATLLVVGVLFEMGGLGTVALDVRDTAREMKKRKQDLDSGKARSPAWVAWWFDRAGGNLRRRAWGAGAIGFGLIVQLAANLVALWA